MTTTTFDSNSAVEIKLLRNKIELGYATPAHYKRYHELINLVGIDDAYINSKLKPYNLNNIEEFQNKKETIKDEHKALGTILGFGLGALFLWSISDIKKK